MKNRRRIFAIVTVTASLAVALCVAGAAMMLVRRPVAAFAVRFVEPVADPREYRLTPSHRDAATTIDAAGFRVDPSSPSIGRGDPVVVMLGDSVPFGAGVGDHDTPAAVLDQRLIGSGWRCLNAGVPSYTFGQSVEHYERQVRGQFNVKAIVLHAANDVSLAHHYGGNWRPSLTWAGGRMSGEAVAFALQDRESAHPMLPHVAAELARFIANRRAENIPVYLVPITLRDGWRDAYYPLALAVNGIIAETGEVVDFRHEPGDFVDQIHLSRAGAEKLADRLSAVMSKGMQDGPTEDR